MAQRKAKEPLLAEIPKPRLSDEELMEMFYSGKDKTTLQAEEVTKTAIKLKSSETTKARDILPGTAVEEALTTLEDEIPDKGDLAEPSQKEPSVEEGYQKEPSLQEPSQEKPFMLTLNEQGEATFRHRETGEKTEKVKKIDLIPPKEKGTYGKSLQLESPQIKGYPEKPFNKEPSPGEPFQKEPFLQVPFSQIQPTLPAEASFTKETRIEDTFHSAFEILPTLSPLEQLLYLWFLNLSHAVGRESCRVTMALLQRATGVSEKLVRETLRSLLGRGHLRLLDGGAAGRAALYRVAHPREIIENGIEGSLQEPFLQEPSQTEPFLKEGYQGNLPHRNLPRHIERESNIYTLSKREPFPREGSSQEGFRTTQAPGKTVFTPPYPQTLTDSVIDRFYSMTGQLRISRQKRERSRAQLFDLLRQGFRIDDVLYAIDWAREHISTPIHSFGIIPEIIGQALGRRDANRRDKQRPPTAPSSHADDDQHEYEQAKLAEIQASLSPGELGALQQEAAELVDKEYGPQVPGRNTLLRMKLAAILRDRYLKSPPNDKNET
jgi:hypothetical protein